MLDCFLLLPRWVSIMKNLENSDKKWSVYAGASQKEAAMTS